MCLQLSLMDEGGNTKDDLGLPKGTDDAEKLADQIKKDFDDGKELVVTVLKVGCPSCTHTVFSRGDVSVSCWLCASHIASGANPCEA